MKRFILSILALLLVFGIAQATDFTFGTGSTGTSDTIELKGVYEDFTVECFYVDANASISAATIVLQGAIDTDKRLGQWHDMATHIFTAGEITNKKAMFHVLSKPVTRVRFNLSTLTGAAGADLVYCIVRVYKP